MKKSLDNRMNGGTDGELLGRAVAGDSDSLGRLYDRWHSTVYRFALRMSGMPALAEDVTQDVFIALVNDGGQYEGRGKFSSYLLSIARHRTLYRLQQERRFTSISPAEEDSDTDNFESQHLPPDSRWEIAADPFADLSRTEVVGMVRQAIMALPLRYREVVLLCHLHEMSYSETAEIIGVEIGTVCSRLYRARGLLAQRLESLKSEAKSHSRV
ncbi:MAG: RNA polymerase sigma factor [Blastocatellia bacterium]